MDCAELKILVVGLGKSGTSILTYRIADAMGEHKLFFEKKGRTGLANTAMHKRMSLNHKRMIAKNLFYTDEINNLSDISRIYDKKIWIVRDPRDHLISTFFYRWKHVNLTTRKCFVDVLNLVKRKETLPSSVDFTSILKEANYDLDEFVNKYTSTADTIEKLNNDWHLLSYESFVDNKVLDLNKYLGFEININASVDQNFKRVERTKSYGNWRTWFTENDVNILKPIFNDSLNRLNYDNTDWDLKLVDKLSSKEGSEYMEKLVLKEF